MYFNPGFYRQRPRRAMDMNGSDAGAVKPLSGRCWVVFNLLGEDNSGDLPCAAALGGEESPDGLREEFLIL